MLGAKGAVTYSAPDLRPRLKSEAPESMLIYELASVEGAGVQHFFALTPGVLAGVLRAAADGDARRAAGAGKAVAAAAAAVPLPLMFYLSPLELLLVRRALSDDAGTLLVLGRSGTGKVRAGAAGGGSGGGVRGRSWRWGCGRTFHLCNLSSSSFLPPRRRQL